MAETKKTTKPKTKPKTKTPAKPGPKHKMTADDIGTFEKLCGMQCTLEEISAYFNCSEDTVERFCQRTYRARFADVWAKKRQNGFISLRRSMWQKATQGKDTTLMIYLSKNYLGMSDVQKVDIGQDTLQKAAEILGGIDSVIE